MITIRSHALCWSSPNTLNSPYSSLSLFIHMDLLNLLCYVNFSVLMLSFSLSIANGFPAVVQLHAVGAVVETMPFDYKKSFVKRR